MYQKTILALILALLAGAPAAQPPAVGHVTGKAYVNSSFRLTYTWPSILKPVDIPTATAERNDPKAYEFPLFSAKQGTKPYGVMVIAHKLNVSGPHSTPLTGSADLIDRMARTLRPGPILANINKAQKKNASGVVFDELTYTQSGKPAGVIATRVGDYLLVFKCIAQSNADFKAMEASALNSRLEK